MSTNLASAVEARADAVRSRIVRVLVVLFAAVSACASAPPTVRVPPLTAPARTTTGASPAPMATIAATASVPLPTFVLRTASTKYDFRLSMKQTCPGEAADSIGCAGKAVLHVLDKNERELQAIALDEAWVMFDAHGQPLADSAALYDDQGTINVGDFDFDGREDFAVQIDQSGPYGGPTFDVYLHVPGEERFVRSDALSQLTRDSLGFFRVDAARKRLVTFSKSGCCYHVTEENEVVRGKPNVVRREIEDATAGDGFVVDTEETRVGGKWRKRSRRVPVQ